MTNTLIDYVQNERRTFAAAPFCEVDSVVFSAIVYLSFEHGVVGRVVPAQHVPLPVALCGVAWEDLLGRCWLSNFEGAEFIAALLQSPRFMSCDVAYYVNEVSSHFEKQFAAITFFLPGGGAYVAFRGTDNSLTGWKENFNQSFLQESPGQHRARQYVEDIAGLSCTPLYVGGHSKGGNLAEYAALTCTDATYGTIARVFSHDGPGFMEAPSQRIATPEYAEKLRKSVPEASLFGLIMEQRQAFQVVQANGFFTSQHALTNWLVEDGALVPSAQAEPQMARQMATFNEWTRTYDPAQRELFIDTVFDVLGACGIENWSEFNEERIANALAMIQAAADLDPQLRSTILGMFREAGGMFGQDAMRAVRQAARDRISTRRHGQ